MNNPNDKKSETRLVADIPHDLKQRFHLAALRRGQTLKELTIEVLHNWLEEHEPEAEIKQGRATT